MDANKIDIDANTSMDIDAPTLSIDGPAGNITSNSRTLHTHKHDYEDARPDPAVTKTSESAKVDT